MSKLNKILFGRRFWAIVIAIVMVLQLLPATSIAETFDRGNGGRPSFGGGDSGSGNEGIGAGHASDLIDRDGDGDPEKPDFPVGPEATPEPENPVEPQDPEDPADPEDPVDPQDPVDPEDGTKPQDPEDGKPGDEPQVQIEYPVIFLDEDGKVLVRLSVLAGTAIGKLPSAPAVGGKTFAGWYTRNGYRITSGTIVNGTIRVYARYDEIPEDEMPAQNFVGVATNGVTVKASVDAGVFPADTRMRVTAVDSRTAKTLALKAVREGRVLTGALAVDITFVDAAGNKIEPKDARDVRVSLTTMDPVSGDEFAIYHVTEGGSLEYVADASKNGGYFTSGAFSVYVVIGTGDDARIAVNFVQYGGEVVTIFVKKQDLVNTTDQYYETVLYDPGAGDLGQGISFYGWTEVENYTTESPRVTIQDIRETVRTKLNAGVTDGEELTYYAAVFKPFVVTYRDPKGTVLGSATMLERPGTVSADYTISMDYTVDDPDQNFIGWYISPAANATLANGDPVSSGTAYPNGTEITLKGSVTLSVYAPSGAWLIFKENGSGATYTKPQFLESSDVTVEPEDPTRDGYDFGGWFREEACTTPFTFGSALAETTTVYAKWTEKTTAKYTVLLWKQNVAGDGYDFYDVFTFENAAVGSTIQSLGKVIKYGTDDDAYVTIDGVAYRAASTNATIKKDFTGFRFDHFDPALTTTVSPKGDTVINVYYNRIQYTLTFQAPTRVNNPSSSDTELYGYVTNNGIGYVHLTRRNNRWEFQYNGTWYRYSTYGNGYYYHFTTIKTITALYQQPVGQNFPIVGTNGVTYDESWEPQNSTVFGNGKVGFIDVMPAESVTFHFYSFGSGTDYGFNYYVEALPGETNVVTYEGKNYVLYTSYVVHANGGLVATYDEDFIDIVGFDRYTSNPEFAYDSQYGTDVASLTDKIDFYYTRKTYTVNFMDGVYLAGNSDDEVDNKSDQQIHVSEAIGYGADISELNSFVPENAPLGYTFVGWYLDKACNSPANFTTMPEGGITVYAKWHNTQYRVFLHPNVPTSEPDTFLGGQATSFRMDYGDSLEYIDGHRNEFELVGWYTDSNFQHSFKFDAYPFNDENITAVYNKSRSTETDLYGNVTSSVNKDADRPWIRNCLDLYARWRSKLDGADGIGVVYIPGNGTGAPTDDLLYKDLAKATAGSASIPNDENQVFAYWVVQKWNGSEFVDTEVEVYPGATFEVLKSSSKVLVTEWVNPLDEDDVLTISNPTPGTTAPDSTHTIIKTATYTVQLRAEYTNKEQDTPTHIYWYANNGTSDVVKTNTLDDGTTGVQFFPINQAVVIKPADTFTYEGHKFLGWAKSADATEPWIAWDGTSFKYNGSTATYVAADEKQPYDDLYAIWEPIHYTVHFDKNNGTGSQMADQDFTYDEAQNLTANTYTRTNYTFLGWSTDPNATTATYTDMQSVINLASEDGAVVTLYAVWKLNSAEVVVHHYLKGTTTKVAEDVTEDYTIGTEIDPMNLPAPTFLSTFAGYNLTKDSTNPATTVTVTEDGAEITIYYTLPLTITANAQTYTYNGSAQGENNATYTSNLDQKVTVEGLLPDDSLTRISLNGQETDAGEYENKIVPSGARINSAYISGAMDDVIPSYYVVTYVPGTLVIEKAEVTITITANSATYVYDGREHKLSGYTFVSSNPDLLNYVKDFKLFSQAAIDAGVYEFSLLHDDITFDTDPNLIVNYVWMPGTLTITPRPVTLVSETAAKTYDGTPLTRPDVSGWQMDTANNTGFVTGEVTDVHATGTITNPGSVTNTIVYTTGTNFKASNYTIQKQEGTLTVNPVGSVTVTIKENSGTFTYDGSEKTVTGYEVVSISDPLYKETDFTFSGNATVKGTNAGTYNMELKPADFTNNNTNFTTVNFVIQDGTLVINPAGVVLTAVDAEASYNGELRYIRETMTEPDEHHLTSDPEGLAFASSVYAYAEGILPGDYPITFPNVVIAEYDNEGNLLNADTATRDTTGNYVVTAVVPATFTIYPYGNYNSSSDPYTGYYDGQPHIGSWTATPGDSITQNLEMVIERYVKENGEWVRVDEWPTLTDVGQTMVKAVAYGVDPVTRIVCSTQISSEFPLTTIWPRPVTLTSASAEKVYDGEALVKNNPETDITVGGMGFVEGEGATYSITGTQTVIGESPNWFTYTLNANTKASNYTITKQLGTLKVTNELITISGTKSWVDAGPEDRPESITVELRKNSAVGELVDSRTVTAADSWAYAFENVPKYAEPAVDGVNEVIAYTVTEQDVPGYKVEYNGYNLINHKRVAITVGKTVVDGDPNQEFEFTVRFMMAEGYFNIGDVSTWTDVALAMGEDEAENRDAIANDLLLQIIDILMTTSDGYGKLYLTLHIKLKDGETRTFYNFTYGTDYIITETGVDNYFASSGSSVGENGEDFAVSGTLHHSHTVVFTNTYRGPITIVSADGEWNYDGETHKKEEYTVTYDGNTLTADATGKVFTLPTGDVITITPTAAGVTTVADNAPNNNTFTYTITNAAGDDVSAQYPEFEPVFGTLKINKMKIRITVEGVINDGPVYDGTEHKAEGFDVVVIEVYDSEINDFNQIDPDKWPADLNFRLADGKEAVAKGVDVVGPDTLDGITEIYRMFLDETFFTYDTDNYEIDEITIRDGWLKIFPRKVTLTSATDEKPYDGTALTNDTVTVGGEGFAPGEGATYDVTGSQTLVGQSDNTFTYTLNDNTKASNYIITTEEGTLTVTDENVPDDLVVKKVADDATKAYNVGDTVTFTVTATNIYDEPKTITLTEIEGVTLSQSVFENVPAGASVTATATYVVTGADVVAGSFTNTVKAKIDDLEKTATATVNMAAAEPSLTVTKTASPTSNVKVGDTVTYTVVVTNNGNVKITGIALEDSLVTLNEAAFDLEPGASKTITYTYTVKQSDHRVRFRDGHHRRCSAETHG